MRAEFCIALRNLPLLLSAAVLFLVQERVWLDHRLPHSAGAPKMLPPALSVRGWLPILPLSQSSAVAAEVPQIAVAVSLVASFAALP